jgi:hypothetical protein
VPRALRLRLPGAFPDEPLLSLEQPDCSIMWLLAAVASWMQATGGWTSRLSYCQFGMPWRKATRIHFSSDFGFAVLDRMCSSRQDGHKHEQLTGWEANAFRTSKASAYPRLLAKAWAAAVDAWWVQHGARSGLPRRALELFAGSGHLAQALRELGWEVVAVDILYGPQCDVLKSDVREALRRSAAARSFAYIHAGTPCTTFSRARHPCLRTSRLPLGIPGLSRDAQQKVLIGNTFVKNTLEIFEATLGQLPRWSSLMLD